VKVKNLKIVSEYTIMMSRKIVEGSSDPRAPPYFYAYVREY